jgi:hypothetical protein
MHAAPTTSMWTAALHMTLGFDPQGPSIAGKDEVAPPHRFLSLEQDHQHGVIQSAPKLGAPGP